MMSLAIAGAVLQHQTEAVDLSKEAVFWMQKVGRPYPHCGFGGNFYHWIYSDDPKPYNSFGNGAAMRVSACGLSAKTLEAALQKRIMAFQRIYMTRQFPIWTSR